MTGDAFLAFDLGAESGRAILGVLENDRLSIRELSRFRNAPLRVHGHQHWDLYGLFEHIKEALRLGAQVGGDRVCSIGIDTWGVDFGLLAEDGTLLGLPFAYRDHRTDGIMDKFLEKHPRRWVYDRTGIQFLAVNTLYQLYSMVLADSPLLRGLASDLLFMPDLFHWLLTGIKKTEFTIATTSQLYNATRQVWDPDLCAAAGCSALMQDIVQPGTVLGPLTPEICSETGTSAIPVVAVASHDTGSAVAAVPAEGKDWAYISSGTWSLMGIESREPVITAESFESDFTNEGGVGGTTRVLRNIMSLWLLQECRKSWAAGAELGYPEIMEMAAQAPAFVTLIDPDDPGFLNPPDMPSAIDSYCRKSGQPVPASNAAMARCVLESIALKYRLTLERLRRISVCPINRIHVIGGGTQNRLLCRFTAEATGLPVYAGPVEATAIGNLLVQAMAAGRVTSLEHLRSIVRSSCCVDEYSPRDPDAWAPAHQRFLTLGPA